MNEEVEEAREWDSEKRSSPYSIVADVEDEWCDCCGDDHTCQDCTEAVLAGLFHDQDQEART